ncbi:MAG: bifunctional methylenetetrahydrofolate dehydrogenase/methenyltetrahydrofolate cyclohydrolase FolD [Ruminococcaceae bacterium]|nr:bifunctional methylenetetrahydrofolate dehydrogenase/methenyltetrahydrofolate cyclohydrolase FolD [Oscillospiraceae bacterium]
MTILDGKALAAKIKEQTAKTTAELASQGKRQPCLAVVLVGEDPASQIYVRNKHNDCVTTGIKSLMHTLPADTKQEDLLSLIDSLNADDGVDGILVQLPLPKHLDEKTVTERISASKDVDAFSAYNVGKITLGRGGFKPCTPAGIMRLLEEYNIEIAGKECVVVGRSNIVGKPMALLLLAAGGTVTVCHTKTADLAYHTRRADILIAAAGRADLIKGDMVKEGAVIVDVGMNRKDGKLCGDVNFEECAAKASYITPVPGGVGPMTRAMLLENTLTAYTNK